MIVTSTCAIVEADYFGSSVIPKTVRELKKVMVPEHDFRSDADFFVICVFPFLKHPALAFYEGQGKNLEELISKTGQEVLDRGLANALKALVADGIKEWDVLIPLVLERVTSFKSLTYYCNIVIRQY